jgi:putative transposase
LIVGFVDEYRKVYSVESICRVLAAHGVQIAPRTYRKARLRPPSDRDIADAYLENSLRDLQGTPEEMYGRRKMTRYLRRQGHTLAFCTVDRIMRELGMNGAVRGQRHRTTIPGKDGVRAGDKLNRNFTADAPNRMWVADFSYVSTWSGWAYVAFVFDAYSRAIVGWTASNSKTTALVSKALNMAVWRRDHYGHPIDPGLIHHSDAGSRGGFNWSTQRAIAAIVDGQPSLRPVSAIRGLPGDGCLSAWATAANSAALHRERSVPFGKYCRRKSGVVP